MEIDGRKSCRRRKRRNFFWQSIIQMTRLRNRWILRILLEEGILLLKYSKCYNNKWSLPPLKQMTPTNLMRSKYSSPNSSVNYI
jgi:hypothetical protein